MAMYGKTQAKVDDVRAWAQHDHGKNWDDGGAVKQILAETASELEKLVAHETKAAVQDYASAAEMALGVSPEGHLMIGCRLWNEDAGIIFKVPFLILVREALTQIKPDMASNTEAIALFSAMVDAGVKLANMGRGSNTGVTPHTGRTTSGGTHQEKAVRTMPQRPVRNESPI